MLSINWALWKCKANLWKLIVNYIHSVKYAANAIFEILSKIQRKPFRYLPARMLPRGLQWTNFLSDSLPSSVKTLNENNLKIQTNHSDLKFKYIYIRILYIEKRCNAFVLYWAQSDYAVFYLSRIQNSDSWDNDTHGILEIQVTLYPTPFKAFYYSGNYVFVFRKFATRYILLL